MQLLRDISTCGASAGVFAQPRPEADTAMSPKFRGLGNLESGDNAPPHIRKAISHASPSARQSKRILPFSEPLIIRSITRVPKPWRIGCLTDGPPLSVHRSTSRPSAAHDHLTSTPPSATDRAPYVAALVASSCKVTAIA